MLNFSRREILRIGAVSVLGTAAGGAWRASGAGTQANGNQAIFIMLQGGPSHLDLWDPKPQAGREIRGPWDPIPTRIPGVRFGELLKNTAQIADKITVIRSMSHRFTNHIAGTYVTMTGSNNQPDQDREAHPDDFPGPGAILARQQPAVHGVPTSVSLPNWLSIPGPSNRMPGQYGGFLGSVHDPFVIEGDPSKPDYNPLSLRLPDGMTPERLAGRISLVEQVDAAADRLENQLGKKMDSLRRSAFELIVDGRVRRALDLEREPAAVRDRYGRDKIGQSLLLARRLIEAGVRFVSYNDFNQRWDTHSGILYTYRVIVPPMERAYAALVSDLAERGLLDTTMVVNAGEFGRTPTVNKDGGRDHWPNVYSVALAGGKVKRGFVHGASDNKGGEVAESAVHPADVLATLWHHLGISPRTTIADRLGRPYLISEGKVIEAILA
ncbi:MAG: DUF1501 domain-containing protein [Verrucomicrobia bacterium]|nr:DUF1501 domain-containing protein [Verrucomicrobiota bacterium]